jgi:hypothetical protein
VFYLDVAYVANVCSKCFIRSRCMLQLFHLSVAKVDLNVGLLSEEEGASAGAMTASMWGGDVGRVAPVWKRLGSHPSGMEEVGAKQCGRDGRGIGVEETGPSHPCNMGSGAKGSGPNAGARSGVGMSGARIRETRVEQAWASGLAQCPGASLSGPIR